MIEYRATNDSRDGTTNRVRQSLPRFGKPPVVEAALSVQFEELLRFKPAHFGLLWERWRTRYPRTEHHPPVPPAIELFGNRATGRASVSIQSEMPVGRYWYLTEDAQRLVQVQPDRFTVNWRKLDDKAEYPSYESLREQFQAELRELLVFLDEENLGPFKPTQGELTYVNHFFAGEGWKEKSELPNVLAPWSGRTTEAYLPDLEDARLAWQYRFENPQGIPLGRLHVQVQSGLRTSDKLPLFVLQMIGRGAPVGAGMEGVLAFTDLAHEWIVNGFTAITTERMHQLWERQR